MKDVCLFCYSGFAADAIRGGDGDEHVRQGEDQRQPPPALPQHEVLRTQTLNKINHFIFTTLIFFLLILILEYFFNFGSLI